ncbi:TetR/AcrR family transcriptional regulator [Cellulomonas cellasea]|uniref:AcrR family transcriptional regulator n=1 Tax=Cellulomonas cellasea TaxID=43670 RepID=A0A7W4Y9P3_9CELL|nr:TetR/AcrR family transcriptional regulator [Cellulomonas cellasea]MBB2921803.1 AcrR family transcriptional regulator [Cellulomonas cellasea]
MPRTDRVPRRRLDPDARREAILTAAAEAFAREPYAEVTLASVARLAGASEALLYRYFAGKEQLYTAVVGLAVEELLAAQAAALDGLPAGAPVRERVLAVTCVQLDHVADHPGAWALPLSGAASEPAATAELRLRAREDHVERLRGLLTPSGAARHEYALWGFFGFLDAVCLRWVRDGCPEHDRQPLLDAAVGALEGALGDWGA